MVLWRPKNVSGVYVALWHIKSASKTRGLETADLCTVNALHHRVVSEDWTRSLICLLAAKWWAIGVAAEKRTLAEEISAHHTRTVHCVRTYVSFSFWITLLITDVKWTAELLTLRLAELICEYIRLESQLSGSSWSFGAMRWLNADHTVAYGTVPHERILYRNTMIDVEDTSS